MTALTHTDYLQNKNQSLALQAPPPCFFIPFYPFLLPSHPLTVKLAWPGPHLLLSQTSSSILHLLLRNSEARADFLQPCTLPSAGIWRSGGAWLLSTTAHWTLTRSKCRWVRRQTSLPPRVNACRAEMLFIFGRLVWLRSLERDTLKAFWAMPFVCQ